MLVIKIHLLVSVKYWLNLFKEKLSQEIFFSEMVFYLSNVHKQQHIRKLC